LRRGFDVGDGFALLRGILCFKGTAGVVEAAELDRDAGTYTDEGGECAFVEGAGALVLEDLRGTVVGAFVVGCGLESDFDDVCGMLKRWVARGV